MKRDRRLTIGLFGGSFNPPHAGHVHISLLALKRLKLDRIWWLVSPGNPLKETKELASFQDRMKAAKALAFHPKLRVSDIEARLGTRYTVETMKRLGQRFPRYRFVWIMGADNLIQFHRWRGWRAIAGKMPIAVIDRPGATLKALRSPAALTLAHRRLKENEAGIVKRRKPPAWIFLHGPRSSLSSTALRAAQAGTGPVGKH